MIIIIKLIMLGHNLWQKMEKKCDKKVKKQGDRIIYMVPEEEIYNWLTDHINYGHGSI